MLGPVIKYHFIVRIHHCVSVSDRLRDHSPKMQINICPLNRILYLYQICSAGDTLMKGDGQVLRSSTELLDFRQSFTKQFSIREVSVPLHVVEQFCYHPRIKHSKGGSVMKMVDSSVQVGDIVTFCELSIVTPIQINDCCLVIFPIFQKVGYSRAPRLQVQVLKPNVRIYGIKQQTKSVV
ncbi:hypothetical protein BC833DRAFT_656232 [Globomyces pollinis-pini]|nr:hypothetical protein BC833DRAFT_656232 [Globomyces pollinis-pini]